MKLRAKLILLIALITAGMSFVTAYLVADHVEQDALHRAETLTAEHIAAKAREVLTVENFQSQDFHLHTPVFEAFLRQVRTPEILKIKALLTAMGTPPADEKSP